MKKLTSLLSIAAMAVASLFANPLYAQQIAAIAPAPAGLDSRTDGASGTAGTSSPSEGARFWANGGVGLGSTVLAVNGSLNFLQGSQFFSAFVNGGSYDAKSHADIGVIYGIGGGDAFMYSAGIGLAYVDDQRVTFENSAGVNHITRTVGIPVQVHGSWNTPIVGIDAGLHLCVSARTSAAFTLGLNIGKLWK
jgi:hypothetical protein